MRMLFSIIYEGGEEAVQFTTQLHKTCDALRIRHNTLLHVEDFIQNFRLQISIQHA
jgi:hypothetical protein